MGDIKKTAPAARPIDLPKDKFQKHLEAIGSAIIADAETISMYKKIRCIEISAEINPYELVTEIEYRIKRLADPRALGGESGAKT